MEEQMSTDVRSAMRKYFGFISETILRARVEAVRSMRSESLRSFLIDPGKFLHMPQSFYQDFFKTRMFLVFMGEGTVHTGRYLVDIGENTSIFLPYVLMSKEYEIGALKLWIELYSGDFGKVIEFLSGKQVLDLVGDALFRRLSNNGEYDLIKKVISSNPNLSSESYRAINITQKMPTVEFGDLSGYTVYLLRACDCRALHIPDPLKGSPVPEIKERLKIMRQDIFDLDKEGCCCVSHRSVLFVDGLNYLCYLLAPENVSMVLNTSGAPQTDRLQAFWSAVAYFLYFDLPITRGCMDVEVDFIIEEPFHDFGNVASRPSFYTG
jgi:hypothetical protein